MLVKQLLYFYLCNYFIIFLATDKSFNQYSYSINIRGNWGHVKDVYMCDTMIEFNRWKQGGSWLSWGIWSTLLCNASVQIFILQCTCSITIQILFHDHITGHAEYFLYFVWTYWCCSDGFLFVLWLSCYSYCMVSIVYCNIDWPSHGSFIVDVLFGCVFDIIVQCTKWFEASN